MKNFFISILIALSASGCVLEQDTVLYRETVTEDGYCSVSDWD